MSSKVFLTSKSTIITNFAMIFNRISQETITEFVRIILLEAQKLLKGKFSEK